MKLKQCFDADYILYGTWVLNFGVEDVDANFIEEAKRVDGKNYCSRYFFFRVYYHENDPYNLSCDVMYTTDDGEDMEMDYTLSEEEKEYVLEKVRKVIGQ